MTDETPKPERKKIVEFEQVKSKELTLNMLLGLALIVFTWAVIGVGGWFVYEQNHMLKQQLASLAGQQENAPAPLAENNPVAVEPLLQRIGFLEEQITQLSMQVAQKLESQQDAKGEIVASVANISPEVRKEMETLQAQVAQTQQMIQELQKNRDFSSGLVAAITLRDAVNNGKPYAQELATLATFTQADEVIQRYVSILQPYAKEGITQPDILKEAFQGVISKALKASQTNADEGVVKQWLKDNLSEVVQVRRIGKDVEGTTTEAILARAESHVQQGHFSQALKELQALQGKPLEAVNPWVKNVTVYLSAKKAANGIYRRILAYVYHPAG